MATKKPTMAEYMCTVCGQKKQRAIRLGRPLPEKCNKKPNKGPYSWIINRKW